MGLLYGPRWVQFLLSEVPLYGLGAQDTPVIPAPSYLPPIDDSGCAPPCERGTCKNTYLARSFEQEMHVHVSGEREFFIDNLLARIHFIIVMIRWTGLSPWEFEFPFPGSLTSTFLDACPCFWNWSMRTPSGPFSSVLLASLELSDTQSL